MEFAEISKAVLEQRRRSTSKGKKPSLRQSWRDALWSHVRFPDVKTVIANDEYSVCIRDKFPKARIHYLLLPKESTGLCVDSIVDLRASKHNKALEKFHSKARSIVADSHRPLQVGYHAMPSMRPLHVHIISTDFDSDCLKNKKHWNSFTSPFFVTLDEVETQMKKKGRVLVDRDEMKAFLKAPLRCHLCSEGLKNMPALKRHIRTCADGTKT